MAAWISSPPRCLRHTVTDHTGERRSNTWRRRRLVRGTTWMDLILELPWERNGEVWDCSCVWGGAAAVVVGAWVWRGEVRGKGPEGVWGGRAS